MGLWGANPRETTMTWRCEGTYFEKWAIHVPAGLVGVLGDVSVRGHFRRPSSSPEPAFLPRTGMNRAACPRAGRFWGGKQAENAWPTFPGSEMDNPLPTMSSATVTPSSSTDVPDYKCHRLARSDDGIVRVSAEAAKPDP